jgi:GNAT superfamily N-acetyltransferase
MEIRTLSAQDIITAMEFVWQVFSEFESPEYSEEGCATFKAFIEDPSNITEKMAIGELHLWGTFDGTKIVGVIAIRPPLHISLLFVDKAYQRKGIARKLFETVIGDRVIIGEHTSITVNSSPYAVEIYRRLGFVTTDAEQTKNGLRFTPMICKLC